MWKGKEGFMQLYGLNPSLQSWGFQVSSESCPVMSYSLQPHGLSSPWDSLGQNTGVGSLISWGSSQPRDWTQVSHIAGGFFTIWATKEAHAFTAGQAMILLLENTEEQERRLVVEELLDA